MASMGKTKKLKKKRDWKHFIPYYLMGLPMVIYLFINNYMPLYGLLFEAFSTRVYVPILMAGAFTAFIAALGRRLLSGQHGQAA